MQQKQQQLLLQQLTGICLSPQIKLKEEKTHVFHSFFFFLMFSVISAAYCVIDCPIV